MCKGLNTLPGWCSFHSDNASRNTLRGSGISRRSTKKGKVTRDHKADLDDEGSALHERPQVDAHAQLLRRQAADDLHLLPQPHFERERLQLLQQPIALGLRLTTCPKP